MRSNTYREAILATVTTAFLAAAGSAQAQMVKDPTVYDTGPLDMITEATSVAMKWAMGEIEYNAPKVTYDGPPITVRTSLHTPAPAWTSKTWKWQFDALERMTNGKIVADHRWGMTVHHISKGFEANRDNLTDASPCWTFYKSNSFPMLQSMFLPGISPNTAVHSIMGEKLYDQYFREEYERQGVYMGRIRATSPYVFFAKQPIREIADLKGLKVRSGGGIHADVQAALGAVPTSMSSAEFYTAFQRGIIDVVSLNDAAGQVFKIDELTTHRTFVNLSRVILEMCLNKRWVDSLPADLRAVVDHWGRAASQVDAQLSFMVGGAQARKGFVEKGIELITIPAEQEKKWQEAVAPVIEAYIKENEEKGLPARQLVADMRKLVDQYAKMTPNEIMMETINNPVRGMLPGS